MRYFVLYHRPFTEFTAMTLEEKAAAVAMMDLDYEIREKARKKAQRKGKA